MARGRRHVVLALLDGLGFPRLGRRRVAVRPRARHRAAPHVLPDRGVWVRLAGARARLLGIRGLAETERRRGHRQGQDCTTLSNAHHSQIFFVSQPTAIRMAIF
jgi:hypothetical protein